MSGWSQSASPLERSDGSSSRVVVDVIDGADINLSVAGGTINDSGTSGVRGARWTPAIDQSVARGISVGRNLNYSSNNPDVSRVSCIRTAKGRNGFEGG